MAAAADAAAAPAAAAAATADPIRKFNYICATDTSCYAVAAAAAVAFGFSKPARAALRSDVVVDQQRSNKLYTRSLLCCCSQWRCAALHVPGCLCVCVNWCLPAQLRQKCSHSHSHRHTQRHARRQAAKSFCTKSFLRRISCAVLFFKHAHTRTRPPLLHTHTHSSSSDAAHQKLHRQRGDKTKMKKK